MAGTPEVITPWFNASANTGSTCVDVQHVQGGTQVRHSKHPDGPVLDYTTAEWDTFVEGVKAGKFDSPAV
jgi:hypothetical protein